jgi:hypothetical protein
MNLDLLLKVALDLEIGHVKGLCLANLNILYINLLEVYDIHSYPPSHIWNCDEYNPQAS